MEKIEVNKQGLVSLKVLIDFYTYRIKTLKSLIDVSYSAFLDYVNAKSFLQELKNTYYKLTDKEIDE